MIGGTNLEEVDPRGRLDVMLYRGAEMLARHIESQHGLNGVWDTLKPHVNNAVVEHMAGVEVPTEAKILLQLVQANWKKEG